MSVRVGIGPGSGARLWADEYWQWVDACETSGIDSIWHSDQLLGETLEPMSLMAALAARTRRMRFGTSAMVVPFRDPVTLAKEIATVDHLGGGRLLPVFGVGNASDRYWSATGTDPRGRGSRSNEAIDLIRCLLEQDEVAHQGAHYRYHGPGIRPRPAKPIPIWIGGNTPAAFRRTARQGDGWLGSMIGPGQAEQARRQIEAGLQETGRQIDSDHYGITLMLRLGADGDPAVERAKQRLLSRMPEEQRRAGDAMFVTGAPDGAIAALRRYVDAGISKFVLIPVVDSFPELMEQSARLAGEIIPAVEG